MQMCINDCKKYKTHDQISYMHTAHSVLALHAFCIIYIYSILTWQQDDSRRDVESISVPVSVEVIKVHVNIRCHHGLCVLLG